MEFALIVPLFLLLLFGVIEFSLINASIGAFNFAAKDAARFGAIQGKNGIVTVGATTVDLDTFIVTSIILPRVNGVVVAKGTEVDIFNSDDTGSCVIVSGSCQQDVWRPSSSGVWSSVSNSWDYSLRNDELSNADYLGVKISYSYTYLTAFFVITSPTINLTALSVQRIEPQQYGMHPDPVSSVWTQLSRDWPLLGAIPSLPVWIDTRGGWVAAASLLHVQGRHA